MRYYEAYISTKSFGKQKIIKIKAKNEKEAEELAKKKLPNKNWALDYVCRVLKQDFEK